MNDDYIKQLDTKLNEIIKVIIQINARLESIEKRYDTEITGELPWLFKDTEV